MPSTCSSEPRDGPSIVHVGEDAVRSRSTDAAARSGRGAGRGRCASSGSARRPRCRLPAQCPRGGRRDACDDEPRSDLVGCAPDFGIRSVIDRFVADRAEGTDGGRRVPLQRSRPRSLRGDRGAAGGAALAARDDRRRGRSIPIDAARRPGVLDLRGAAAAASEPSSSKWHSTTRCGSCSPRARPDCPRASCRATAGSSSSTSSHSGCAWTCGPATATCSTARRAGWRGTTWSGSAARHDDRPLRRVPRTASPVASGRSRRPTGATVLGMGSAYVTACQKRRGRARTS